ncbi:hypothetical protein Bint_1664 [Brachyspira intermedia PWS/A]|uniref:Uncharacterized protein n=1 Tax=Brachyspira intermedia (strain ATCC 51140 / PWS/A) TaxID=1045858 RepID=G0EIT1_BRAIP|nr:hypothetical protein Bint_1664 [Brachyspira intermedia PWS/A]
MIVYIFEKILGKFFLMIDNKPSSYYWLGLAWLGLAWLGLAWLGLAWLGCDS